MSATTRLRVFGAAAAAIGALVLTASAFAARSPKPEDPTIVPAESIGGISVGQAGSDAEAAWGDVGVCRDDKSQRTCKFGSVKKGSGQIIEGDDVVVVVEIRAPLKGGEFAFRGPLMDFRTAKGGLGLGSKLRTVARKLPKAAVIKKRSVTIKGDGVEMLFFSSDKKHVTQILIRDLSIN